MTRDTLLKDSGWVVDIFIVDIYRLLDTYLTISIFPHRLDHLNYIMNFVFLTIKVFEPFL